MALFNSKLTLHSSIVFGSVHNMNSTIAENMRYYMYKYGIVNQYISY